MRYLVVFVFAAALVLGASASAAAQPGNQSQNSADKAATLRAQLSEVETKQSGLKTRLEKLEEDLKPENIAENLAGIGSTKPEDLREQRRRQLEIERNGVRAQLDLLATSHARLEASIAQADADAYRQSAAPVTPVAATTAVSVAAPASNTPATTPARPRRVGRKKARRARRLHHGPTSLAPALR
jgi:TolA-binding protein